MNLIKHEELKQHDVYEVCYDKNHPKHWNKDSLFMTLEDFTVLSPHLDNVYENYHYYGPQKIMLKEWSIIKKSCLDKHKSSTTIENFFSVIDKWIKNDPESKDFFWIYGI